MAVDICKYKYIYKCLSDCIYVLLVVSFVVAGSDIFSSQHCTFSLFPQNEGSFLPFCQTPEFRAMILK